MKLLTSRWFARYEDMPKMFNLMSSASESHLNEPDQFSEFVEVPVPLLTESSVSLQSSNKDCSSDFLWYKLSWRSRSTFISAAERLGMKRNMRTTQYI